MKKHLLLGLAIIIGSNIAAMTGVVVNRSGEPTSHLTLTERELSLPYNIGAKKENSGFSFSINWRTPTQSDKSYSPYSSKDIELTKSKLLALGFDDMDNQQSSFSQSLELYWAFEFDGALHDAEIQKAAAKYQEALLAFEEQPNDKNKRTEKQLRNNLSREKISKSRLFYIEAAADYEYLIAKYSDQSNILIAKGLANYYHYSNNKKNETYSVYLKNLSVENIMIPLKYIDVFSGLSRANRQEIQPPRYSVNINWGSRLEPWIVNTERLID